MNIFFIIVGDGYLKDELTSRTEGQSNILFLPKIPKNQVQHLLTFFDVCFVGRNDSPLFKHGVSANKYFDYMLAGKPILDSNNHIKDPVELSGCGVIVKPDSAEAIRDGIIALYELPELERTKMGTLGKEYVTKYHDISYLSDQYAELFQTL
jgi:glycosyltransferase involved in cell wall biosynthesis